MALETLWALLNRGVSEVSGVQPAPVLDFPETPTGFHGVSGVSGRVSAGSGHGAGARGETPETPAKNTGFQEKMARALACTPETPETPKKSNIDAQAANDGQHLPQPAPPPPPPPPPAPALIRAEWAVLDKAYQAHHFGCPVCIAAGKGYGLRCEVGQGLWNAYETHRCRV